MKSFITTVTLLVLTVLAMGVAAEKTTDAPRPDGLRGAGYSATPAAPPIAGVTGRKGREERNYPEQPPVIPHSIDGYQLDKRFNQCLDCHSRSASPESGAPMVSITHFMDRNKQVLAAVSPDRYFCTQCHVPQTDVDPLVENQFETVDEVLRRLAEDGDGEGGAE